MSMKNRSDCIIGKRIREQRKKKGMSQVDLSHMLRVNDSTISKYENGDASVPLDTLITIADIFDVSVDYLLGRSESAAIENYAIGHELGLTDETIETLKYIKQISDEYRNYIKLINAFLSDRSDTYNFFEQLFAFAIMQHLNGYINSEQLPQIIVENIENHIKKFVMPQIYDLIQQNSDIYNRPFNEVLNMEQFNKDVVKMYKLLTGKLDSI